MKPTQRFGMIFLALIAALATMAPLEFGEGNGAQQAGTQSDTTAADVFISPADVEVTINLGDNVTYGFGWFACTKGLTIDLLRSTQIIVAVRRSGATVQRFGGPTSRPFWSSPAIVPGADTSVCFWPAADLWNVVWENDQLVFDEAGVYRIVLVWRLNEPIIDGYFNESGVFWYDTGLLYTSTVKVNVVP